MIEYLKIKKRTGGTRKVIGSPKLEKILLSEKCLKQWAHLSIYKRSLKIKQLYNVHVPKETLRRYYKRHDIRDNVAKGDLYPHKKDEHQLCEERQAFAVKLSDFILDENTEVIYFDETSFHSRLVQRKAWWRKGERLKIPYTENRGEGFTLLGAVSKCLKNKGYFEVHRSTKGACVINFMQNI
jgi:hypothetical protein